MRAKDGVLDLLNGLLTIELTAINQYFIQAEMCANWGFVKLHDHLRDNSLEEMKDAQEIIKHILYLEGVPNMQRLNRIQAGETVPENIELALGLERESVDFLRNAISRCRDVEDYTTRAMFEQMIASEEGHIDWLETQAEAIARVGLENYLAQQLA